MDFHCLSRRELQALCKRNKIPANVTNVAMADSLKSLESVEGIDELLHMCESATAQSSIESGVRFEVTSPFVPPTGARSTRRIRAETPVAPCAKMGSLLKDCSQKDPLLTPAPSGATSRRRRAVKEDGSVKQVCPTRQSTRLAEKSARLLKGVADANPDFSKKGLFTDDCHQEIKVNLKESLDDLVEISGVTDVSASTNLEESSDINEEQVDCSQKDPLLTPAPSGATSRRRRAVKEDGSVKQVCPIRRSTRLAEKSARLLKGVADANPDFSKKGLFTDDCHQEIKVNLKESLDDLVEISGITDVSASTNLEESSDINEEQVDSAEKQDVATDAEPAPTIQVKNSNQSDTGDGAESEQCSDENAHTEVLERPDEKEVVSTVEDAELVPTIQEKNDQFGTEDEAESEQEEHSLVETKEQGAGSENLDVPGVEAMSTVAENNEQKAHEVVSTVEEVKLVLIVQEEKSNHSESDDAKTELKDTNNVEVEKVGCVSGIYAEFADVQASETDNDMFNDENQHSGEITELKDNNSVEVEKVGCVSEIDAEFADVQASETDDDMFNDEDPHSGEITELKDTNNVEVEKVGCVSDIYAEFADVQAPETDNDMFNDEDQQSEETTALDVNKTLLNLTSMHEDSSEKESNPVETEAAVGDDLPPPVNKKNVPTPIRASASKASSTMNERMAVAASDNKENIESGTKTRTKIVVKATSEAAIKLDEMGQLPNKFKVTLTSKLDKDEGGNEVSTRHALQVLPDNQKKD